MKAAVVLTPGTIAIEEVPDLANSVQVLGFTYRGSRAIGPDGSTYGNYNLFKFMRPSLQLGVVYFKLDPASM